jgi:4-amino-4-deoxychorismate lyase
VCWRTGSTIFTPSPESGILEGVTRGLLIDIARNLGYAVEEGLFGRERLDSADELFATMTSNGVVPIRRLDARELPSVAAAGRLQNTYWAEVRRELARAE